MSRRTIVGLVIAGLVLAMAAVASAGTSLPVGEEHSRMVDGGMTPMEMMGGDHMEMMQGHVTEMATMMSEHHSAMDEMAGTGHMTEMTTMMSNSVPMGSMGTDHADHHSS